MRRMLFFIAVLAFLSAEVIAQQPAWQPAPGTITLPLWPGGAPGAQPNPAPEVDTTTAKDRSVAGKPVVRLGNVSAPTLTVYSPQKDANGVGVVVFPGGGYKILAIDLEGTEVCDRHDSAQLVSDDGQDRKDERCREEFLITIETQARLRRLDDNHCNSDDEKLSHQRHDRSKNAECRTCRG